VYFYSIISYVFSKAIVHQQLMPPRTARSGRRRKPTNQRYTP